MSFFSLLFFGGPERAVWALLALKSAVWFC